MSVEPVLKNYTDMFNFLGALSIDFVNGKPTKGSNEAGVDTYSYGANGLLAKIESFYSDKTSRSILFTYNTSSIFIDYYLPETVENRLATFFNLALNYQL